MKATRPGPTVCSEYNPKQSRSRTWGATGQEGEQGGANDVGLNKPPSPNDRTTQRHDHQNDRTTQRHDHQNDDRNHQGDYGGDGNDRDNEGGTESDLDDAE